MEFDVVVVGGGPAGSACSMRLACKGARVALIEASDYARFRIGETLEPGVHALLERAGFRCDGGVPCAVPCQGTGSAWGSSRVTLRPGLGHPHGRGWRLDRRAFDQRLFEEVGALGAAVYRSARVVDASRKAGWWHFGIASGAGDARRAGVVRGGGDRPPGPVALCPGRTAVVARSTSRRRRLEPGGRVDSVPLP